MQSLFFVILILIALVLLLFWFDKFVQQQMQKPVGFSESTEAKPEKTEAKTEKRIFKPEKYGLSKNEQRNLRKSLIRARRQGHLSCNYHGNYYATGLQTDEQYKQIVLGSHAGK